MTTARLAWRLLAGLGLALVTAACPADQRQYWLTILASERAPAGAAARLNDLGGPAAGLVALASSNCRNLRPDLFLVSTGLKDERAAAERDQRRWRERGVTDAYVRPCEPVPGSRLALGLPLFDPSIHRRGDDIVNWTYADAVIRTRRLPGPWIAVIRPRFEAGSEDILQGFRVGISIIRLDNGRRLTLKEHCLDPQIDAGPRLIALTCTSSAAGDHLLHTTYVHRLNDGEIILAQTRCRAAMLQKHSLLCQRESVDQDGKLTLSAQHIPLDGDQRERSR